MVPNAKVALASEKKNIHSPKPQFVLSKVEVDTLKTVFGYPNKSKKAYSFRKSLEVVAVTIS